MYIIWTHEGTEGWERNDAETLEEAMRIRNRQVSLAEGEVIVTELIADLESSADPEIKTISQLKKALQHLDKKTTWRIANWVLEYAKGNAGSIVDGINMVQK